MSSVSVTDHPTMKYLRTLVQLILVELSGLTSTGHLVDLTNTMRTTMDEKYNQI